MNTTWLRTITVAAALFVSGAGTTRAAQPAKEDAALVTKLISAVEKSDYPAFIADGEPKFQQISQEQFAAVAASLAPRFQSGYQVSYLGELKQHGYHVTLWKISFKDGGDDMAAYLSTKDGKVGGFFIR